MSDQDAVSFWENRYAERDRIWSGHPNAALVSTASDLTPGHALDLGCGEGGDTVWLAKQGWQVTAVDIATNAITRGRVAAADRGVAEDAITWIVHDLATWQPTQEYDLVSACFLHSPVEFPRTEVLRRAASAVAPGGHLLIVGHAEPPPWSAHAHDHPDLPGPAEELAGLELDAASWDVVVSEVRSREATSRDGEQATLRDVVTFLRRQATP